MTKQFSKIVALLLVMLMIVPVFAACGEKDEPASTTEAAGEAATTTEEVPVETTTPEPTTEKPTTPPTEPPTDPADRPEADAQGIIPGFRYYMRSDNSNLYMAIDGDYKYAGFSQQEWTGTSEQMFVFELIDEEARLYKIRALGGAEGTYIDIADATDENGTLLEGTVEPYSDVSQIWKIRHNSKGHYTLLSGVSNYKKCADVNGVSLDPGGVIHQWEGGSAANQVWYLELVAETPEGFATEAPAE